MYSYSNLLTGGLTGPPVFPHFDQLYGQFKADPSLRALLNANDPHSPWSQHYPPERAHFDEQRRRFPHRAKELEHARAVHNGDRVREFLRKNDPLFERTWDMLMHMFEVLPKAAEIALIKASRDNLPLFLEMYRDMREWAGQVEHRHHHRKKARTAEMTPRIQAAHPAHTAQAAQAGQAAPTAQGNRYPQADRKSGGGWHYRTAVQNGQPMDHRQAYAALQADMAAGRADEGDRFALLNALAHYGEDEPVSRRGGAS